MSHKIVIITHCFFIFFNLSLKLLNFLFCFTFTLSDFIVFNFFYAFSHILFGFIYFIFLNYNLFSYFISCYFVYFLFYIILPAIYPLICIIYYLNNVVLHTANHLSVHWKPSIIYQPSNQPTNLPTYQPTNLPINRIVSYSINQSIKWALCVNGPLSNYPRNFLPVINIGKQI